MNDGRVDALIIVGGNPVYTAPVDLQFADVMNKVPFRVHLSLYDDETSALCHWQIPEAHFLESWSDVRSEDGTVTMLGRGSVSINSGGEKIYPEEVEAALKGHPDVFDALVVGVPDPRYGQHVAAVVQARPGSRPSLSSLKPAGTRCALCRNSSRFWASIMRCPTS